MGLRLVLELAGAKVGIDKLMKSIGFYGANCVCALCARRAATNCTERKSSKNHIQKLQKTRCRESPRTHRSIAIFESQTAPQIDPGGFRERLGGLLRGSSAPRRLQKRSWSHGGVKKTFGAIFLSHRYPSSIRLVSGRYPAGLMLLTGPLGTDNYQRIRV